MGLLRMIKLFAWEERTFNQVNEKRNNELAIMWKFQLYSAIMYGIQQVMSALVLLATFASFVSLAAPLCYDSQIEEMMP